jgi:NAD(P)-dependent dehydrogenase (short-subunit alcohol dehydrogenase family)
MSKTIVICGYGPGISAAVARRFGREGFQVALVARYAQRLAAGVAALAVAFGAMGLGVANAAKRKVVGLLARKLEPRGVYVGEVMVLGSVKRLDVGQRHGDARGRDGSRRVPRSLRIAQRDRPQRALNVRSSR